MIQKAMDQIDGATGTWKSGRRRRAKQQEDMDLTQIAAGKRGAKEAGTEAPPAPKCPTLPAEGGGKTEHFDLTANDGAPVAAAVAKASEREKN